MTSSATAELYKKINTIFDDVTLSNFCLLHFPIVYDRFSEGMRKDQKIGLLLDHCRRESARVAKLLEALPKEESYTATSTVEAPALSSPPSPPERSGICPFEYGLPVPPERFYGRHRQRADIKARIGGVSGQCISIVGLRRTGKSSLLRYIERRLPEFCRPEQQAFVVRLDLQKKRFQTPVDLVEGLRRGIEKKIGRSPWQVGQNEDEWAVEDGLLELREMGKRLIVLIDEFELLSSRLQAFQGWGEDWRSKASDGCFALVIASLRPLEQIYQETGLTSPFGNIFSYTTLGAFSDEEWQRLVREGFTRSGLAVSEADLALIYDLAGGWPFYTQMAAALLWQYGEHSQTRAAFIAQASKRFAELWNDLKENERDVLRYVAGVYKGTPPHANLHAPLQHSGLLRADGQLFSSPFTDFVRGQS